MENQLTKEITYFSQEFVFILCCACTVIYNLSTGQWYEFLGVLKQYIILVSAGDGEIQDVLEEGN